MRVLVTGSRAWTDRAAIDRVLTALHDRCGQVLTVLHGACPRGADNIAHTWCARRGVSVESYPADWSTGRGAGPRRNAVMVATRPDLVVAFIRDRSPGATGCAALAEKAGISVLRNPTPDDIAALTKPTGQENQTMPDLLAAALAHAARGWHVFPLRPDDKRPAFPDHTADDCAGRDPRCRTGHTGWEQRATTDPDRIRRAWSARSYGVGIACGPSGLVVVDLDVPKHVGDTPPPEWAGACDGWDVFATLAARHGTPIDPFDGFGPDAPPGTGIDATHTVTTGSGGTHLYYRHPTSGPQLRNTTGERGGLGWKVDTRAHGGYVVAAGSTVAGRPYTLALDVEPAPLPGWVAGLLAPAARPVYRPTAVALPPDRRGRYVAAAIRRQVDHLTTAREGQRNHALFVSAVALGQFAAGGALTDDDVWAVLEPAAASIGLPAREIAHTITNGLRVGARNPRCLNTAGRAA